jgi:hypothetical protein
LQKILSELSLVQIIDDEINEQSNKEKVYLQKKKEKKLGKTTKK